MDTLEFYCKWCKKRKTLDNFHYSPTGYMNKKTKCKACTKIANKLRYLKNPHYTKKVRIKNIKKLKKVR